MKTHDPLSGDVIPLLEVRDLAVSFSGGDGPRIQAVSGVSLTVYPRQTVAVVGESGSGKSVTALATLGLLPAARVDGGGAMLACKDGRSADLLRISERERRAIRGSEVAMIFQEPMTSLNPVERVGDQIIEGVLLHTHATRSEARLVAVRAMHAVGIQQPERRLLQYPHEFSGGMRQRVMIAIALACGPRLLIADEPTTALDVTIQAQVLDLVASLRCERGLGVVLITHDLGIVAQHADVVCVMYAGRVVEYSRAEVIFSHPRHPYTRGLLACIPAMEHRPERLATVREFVERPENFVVSGADSATPWWPWHTGHLGAGYALREVGPEHWVGTFGPSSAPTRPPDIRHWRSAPALR